MPKFSRICGEEQAKVVNVLRSGKQVNNGVMFKDKFTLDNIGLHEENEGEEELQSKAIAEDEEKKQEEANSEMDKAK